MSGSVENLWAFSNESDHLKGAFQVAERLGKPKNTYDELVEFFKMVPPENLHQFTMVPEDDSLSVIRFGPTIESTTLNSTFFKI